jgi:DNA repair protein RadC
MPQAGRAINCTEPATRAIDCTEIGKANAILERDSNVPIGLAKCWHAEAAKDAVIRRALRIMESRLKYRDVALNSPQAVRDYLRLLIADKEWEVFVVLFLDAQNRLIAAEEMFRGTLTQTSVYPREVVKAALKHNAAAVIFAHNHPPGVAEPSRADELLTCALKLALALVDCKTLDHLVVAGEKTTSFAERGLL